MYFPNLPTPSQIFPQQQPPNIPQSNTFPAQFPQPQTPFFTYPTVIQPYTDRQFLCHTFNFKVPYIEAFLSLTHEEKLKFFLIIEKRRLTGELTEKESYDKLLHKILLIVNPNYQKPQQQFQEISEEELKKKIIEKQFEQKCDWELRKLGMGEKQEDNSDLWKNYAAQGLGSYTIDGLSSNSQQFNASNTSNTPNPQDEQQFIYQQPQPQAHRKSSVISPRKQPSTPKPEQQQEDEWQQAEQVNPLDESLKLSIGKYDKVESIWDLELNEEDVKKVEPNIREIFGGKKDEKQEDQFGGFYQAKQIDGNDFLAMNEYLKPTMTSMDTNNQNFSRNPDKIPQEQFPPSSIDQFTPYNQPFTQSNDHFTPYNQQNTTHSPLNNDWLLSGSIIQPHTILSNPMTQNNPQQKPSSQPLFSFQTPQVLNPPSSLPVLQLDFLSLSQSYQAQATVQTNYSNEFNTINDGNRPEVHHQSTVQQDQDQFVEAEFVEASYQEANQMNFKENQEKIPSAEDYRNPFEWNAQISQVKQTLEDSHPQYQPNTNTSPIINEDIDLTANKKIDNQWTFTDTNDQTITEKTPQQTNDLNINTLPQSQQPILTFTQEIKYTTFQSSVTPNDDPFSSIQTVQTPVINSTFTLEPLATANQPLGTFKAQTLPQLATQPMNFVTNSSQLYDSMQQKPQTIIQNKSAVSQAKSPSQIRPIRKIAKPPTVKYDEEFVKKSDQDNLVYQNKSSVLTNKQESLVQQGFTGKNTNQINSTLSQPSLSQVVQPKNVYSTQIPRPTPLKPLSIVTQIHPSTQPSVLPQALSQSTYTPTQPKQKIISTYNRNFLYSPRFQERKRQTFPAKRLLSEEEQKQRSINEIEQHSMVDGMLGRDSLGSPVFGRLRKPVSNEQIDYSVEVQDGKDNKVKQVQDVDDEQILDQSEESNQRRPQHIHKRTATSPELQPAYNFSKKPPPSLPNPNNHRSTTSQPPTNPFQHLTTLLTTHSQQLTYQLPQQVTTYLLTQTSSNKFCFDKDFYVRLGKILEFLSMERELVGLREQFGYSDGVSVSEHVFCEEVEFLAEILKKLERIDELNKQFTVAMEEDQEEQLAEVVMKSKQLTFQVNEDAQQAKRIAKLILRYRVTQPANTAQNKLQDDIIPEANPKKYQGIYAILINLLIPTPEPISPTSPHSQPIIPLPILSHLLNLLSPSSSTLLSNIPFLTSFTLLYLLHCHLNQLQYIENISRTVFGYLIKQHMVLMRKINEIKEMSQKYAEAPQVIFGKLMEAPKMVDFLRGLGEMANCAERILRLIKLIGIRLDLAQDQNSNQTLQKYSQQSIQKTITQCRQLAIKYNLISPQQPNLKQYQHYILTILTTCLTNESSPVITYNKVQHLLSQKPICKICMTPKGSQEHGQTGEFITNSAVRSETELGREDTTQVEWCHFVCYNMLKVAFQEANLGQDGFEGV